MVQRYDAPSVDPHRLAEPLTFPSSTKLAPNRFLKAATSELLATHHPTNVDERGIPTPEIITLYRRWGRGGWGQIVTGSIMIDTEHLEGVGNLIIPAGAQFQGPRFEGFAAMAAAAKAHGALILGQVMHPGRQTEEHIQPHPISASEIRLFAPGMRRKFATPRAATRQDISQVLEGFTHAAEYLDKAGFDGIQLHAAHGYLLSQFLSRSTNKRDDEYGGSLENRMRLVLDIVDAIKARVSDKFILGVKINAIEYQEDGINPAEATALCKALEKHGVDYVELSGGNYEKNAMLHLRETTEKREGYFLEHAEQIVPHMKTIKTYVTGGFKTVRGMDDALSVVDGVGLGRAACQEPEFPTDALSSKVQSVIQPAVAEGKAYERLLCARAHIDQLSEGRDPVDLSVIENVESVVGAKGTV